MGEADIGKRQDSIEPVLEAVLAQTCSFEAWARTRYASKLHNTGTALLVPRLDSRGVLESAKLLDTLVLLYDKIYWDSPPNSLLIPEQARDFPEELHRFGVDEGFPDRFIEYMRQGIVTPLIDEGGGSYSAPVESPQELEIHGHLLRTNLTILGWNDLPQVFEAFAQTAKAIAPQDRLHDLIDRYDPKRGAFATVVRLLLGVEKSKALHATNVYVANDEEQLQWRVLSALCHEGLERPDTAMPLDTSSLLRLVEGILLTSPHRLPIDVVLRLRSEIPATKLREWLHRRVTVASERLIVSDPVDHVVDEFNELVKETVAKSTKSAAFTLSFSALAAALGALLSGVPGAIAGSVAGYVAAEASNAASMAWHARYGALGWVLNVHRVRSSTTTPDRSA